MMKCIKSIKFIKDFHPFKCDQQFDFKSGLNLMVGDNGSGKSTLIYLLIEGTKKLPKNEIRMTSEQASKSHYTPLEVEMIDNPEFSEILKIDRNRDFAGDYLYFCTEKHNPRTVIDGGGARWELVAIHKAMNYVLERVNDGTAVVLEKIMQQYYKQAGLDNIDDALIAKFKSHGQVLLPMIESFADLSNGLAYIDEPETALSYRSQIKMRNVMHKAAQAGSQLFVATHCPVLIESVPQVLSLEHGEWMSSADFLESQQ